VEIWIAGANVPGMARKLAERAEAAGFDGISFGDTQCVSGDAFVGLTAAALVTTHLKLAVGVTNPVTRHSAATACAIASVQVESNGRAVLGIGRGDSAVSKLNLRAGTVAELEQYVEHLQAYLSGGIVELGGRATRLEWLAAQGLPKVPLDVAATGPAVIGVGARRADRLTFNVGADRERLARNIEVARQARADAGLPPDGLSFGAWLPVAPHMSRPSARELVKGVTAVYARFQAMPGAPQDLVRPEDATSIRGVAENYDNSRHGRADAAHVARLDDDFIDRFAVTGPPDECVERLAGLVELGIDRFLIVGPNALGSPDDYAESHRLLTEVVMPALRRRAGPTGVPPSGGR
jgi:5,10-methylenetetrahydromethanopterin reductase